jgi:hypothetical protein
MTHALLLAAVALAACAPSLVAQTAPPFGRSARLDEVRGFWGLQKYRLEISRGVALGATCYRGGPCEHMVLTSDNPAIAEIRPAALSSLDTPLPSRPSAGLVVVGKTAGTTRLHVRAGKRTRHIDVTVVDPPAIARSPPRP